MSGERSGALRVGLLGTELGGAWQGGVTYLRNLVTALRESPACGIRPVLLVPRLRALPVDDLGETARSLWLDLQSRVPDGVWLRLGGSPALERAALGAGVDCLSHARWLSDRPALPFLPWIPDLQHRRLPHFFSARECEARDRSFRLSLRQGTLVLVSSEAARRDVEEAYPGFGAKLRVLRFVSCLAGGGAAPGDAAGAGEGVRFLLLPNQFWVHKNHALVLEALGILKGRGRKVLVVATGSAHEWRSPGHFEGLMRRRAELGIEEQFRVEGLVPHARLAALMRGAHAIVNPSLFEGWSTTVEEAKSLGKRVILSDLPVHREQAPARATFFDPADAGQLAEVLWSVWNEPDGGEDARAARAAAEALPARRGAFAERYAEVVREAVGLAPGGREVAVEGARR